MARRGKMIKGVLVAMLTISLLLAATTTYAASVGGPRGEPYPYEYCTTQCGRICLCGSCCGAPEHCYCTENGFKRRCDDYYYGDCLSGWYCTSTPCDTDACCQ